MTLHNPVVLARHAITLDVMSNGRLDLGVGAGGIASDHQITGIPMLDPRSRVSAFGEYLSVLDRALRGDVMRHSGELWRLRGPRLRPFTPARPRPPMTVAAHNKRSLALAARFGDSWISYGVRGASPERALETTRERIKVLEEASAQIGRAPSEIGRVLLVGLGTEEPLSSRDEFVDFVGRYRSVGITHFVLTYPPRTPGYGRSTFRQATNWIRALPRDAHS